MSDELTPQPPKATVFEQIKRQTSVGKEFWSSRDLARVLDYADYRNFEQVIAKAKQASFKSGQRIEDHFVDVTEMIEIGKGGHRPVAESIKQIETKQRKQLVKAEKPAKKKRE